METKILKEMIAVIRTEQQRRAKLRRDKEASLPADPGGDYAYHQWVFTDAPFINELCLMLLVTLRHQVERELVGLAARAADDGEEISPQQYQEKVQEARKLMRNREGYERIEARLNLESCEGYDRMDTLRLLANSCKHDPSMEPDEDLLRKLRLNSGVNYAPLPESQALQSALAVYIGLGTDADYCDIAERFVDIASAFLRHVESKARLSPVKWPPVSFKLSDLAR